MALSGVGLRTANDKQYEAREKLLMEAVAKENENPFQAVADVVLASVSSLYCDYLYASGTMLALWTLWGLYPPYARFRHSHVARFRRRSQREFCRWFFWTRHIPKWDKRHLQCIELPGHSTERTMKVATGPLATCDASQASAETNYRCHSATYHEQTAREGVFATASGTGAAAFAGGGLARMENKIAAGIQSVNESLQHKLEDKVLADAGAVDLNKLHRDVAELVKDSGGVIVLRETHATRRSVVPGRELWWVSLEEALRRKEWWFWAKILIAARMLQDLLDMPDMPDLLQ
ncbi:hypothetical protein ERJ75_000946500 [Trypanosoma vivax]|uniref:Uncharacterized protein n=1 Tax=Trypanosoma vivax (strain Y486) TaxID=1055687 RepID=G0U4G5_TRYVY|nr:hypothetical protein TRVL_04977 [Trypanosoma vivax]KAH8611556.1 hypothetical protein ERJ75_000946500 [Trypanosoma vivax]CCC52329.1 conserved hypothetical protein, fragment [Trypanosoma vivax Y486]